MSQLSEPTIFFDLDAVNLEMWKLAKVAEAARPLLESCGVSHAFIELDNFQANRFLVTVAEVPTEPLFIYEVTVVDEDTHPQLACRFKKA